MTTIVRAGSPEQIAAIRDLFTEYVQWLGINLCYQDYPTEFAELPWKYAPPRGDLLLALVGGQAAGCVALKPIDQETAEFKRFYVRPAFRGRGVGRALGKAIVDVARRLGYRRLWLDTLPSMEAAVAVYIALGFRPIAPWHHTPVKGTLFMELDLRRSAEEGIS